MEPQKNGATNSINPPPPAHNMAAPNQHSHLRPVVPVTNPAQSSKPSQPHGYALPRPAHLGSSIPNLKPSQPHGAHPKNSVSNDSALTKSSTTTQESANGNVNKPVMPSSTNLGKPYPTAATANSSNPKSIHNIPITQYQVLQQQQAFFQQQSFFNQSQNANQHSISTNVQASIQYSANQHANFLHRPSLTPMSGTPVSIENKIKIPSPQINSVTPKQSVAIKTSIPAGMKSASPTNQMELNIEKVVSVAGSDVRKNEPKLGVVGMTQNVSKPQAQLLKPVNTLLEAKKYDEVKNTSISITPSKPAITPQNIELKPTASANTITITPSVKNTDVTLTKPDNKDSQTKPSTNVSKQSSALKPMSTSVPISKQPIIPPAKVNAVSDASSNLISKQAILTPVTKVSEISSLDKILEKSNLPIDGQNKFEKNVNPPNKSDVQKDAAKMTKPNEKIAPVSASVAATNLTQSASVPKQTNSVQDKQKQVPSVACKQNSISKPTKIENFVKSSEKKAQIITKDVVQTLPKKVQPVSNTQQESKPPITQQLPAHPPTKNVAPESSLSNKNEQQKSTLETIISKTQVKKCEITGTAAKEQEKIAAEISNKKSRRQIGRFPSRKSDDSEEGKKQDSNSEKSENVTELTSSAVKRKRMQKTHETADETLHEGERKSKRPRSFAMVYQSPVTEPAMRIPKVLQTPKASTDEKLILFFKNEHVALRNGEGTFFICQIFQNVYKSTRRIKIRWLSPTNENDQKCETFKPDYYDITDFNCILTSVAMKKASEKSVFILPQEERARVMNILERALARDRGIPLEESELKEDHPDGLDLSLYNNEDQLTKSKSRKGKSTRTRTSGGRYTQDDDDEYDDVDEELEAELDKELGKEIEKETVSEDESDEEIIPTKKRKAPPTTNKETKKEVPAKTPKGKEKETKNEAPAKTLKGKEKETKNEAPAKTPKGKEKETKNEAPAKTPKGKEKETKNEVPAKTPKGKEKETKNEAPAKTPKGKEKETKNEVPAKTFKGKEKMSHAKSPKEKEKEPSAKILTEKEKEPKNVLNVKTPKEKTSFEKALKSAKAVSLSSTPSKKVVENSKIGSPAAKKFKESVSTKEKCVEKQKPTPVNKRAAAKNVDIAPKKVETVKEVAESKPRKVVKRPNEQVEAEKTPSQSARRTRK